MIVYQKEMEQWNGTDHYRRLSDQADADGGGYGGLPDRGGRMRDKGSTARDHEGCAREMRVSRNGNARADLCGDVSVPKRRM